MAKREKEPIFTKMEFNDAQYAMDVKQKSEAKLQKVKIGLMIAAVAQLAWTLLFMIHHIPTPLDYIICFIALGGTVAAYIVGGGLGAALKVTWRISKGIGWFGWCCVPFPADIFTGIALSLMSVMMIPALFIFIPLALVFCNFIQVKKDFKAAEEYLKYCTPV